MSKYDKWYIIKKLLCSTFRIEFFIAKSSYIVKMFAKKICPKNEKLYIFEKPLTMPFQICKNVCKILNDLIFNQEKLKMCNLFLAKLVKFVSLCQRLCKKMNFIKIWQVEGGQNKDLVAVIQAVCLRTQAVSIKARF